MLVPVGSRDKLTISVQVILGQTLTLVDPVDQGSWAPTKVNVPFVTRSGNAIYFTQFFTYDQAELDALINLNATLAWEFRRPTVDINGVEQSGNVDYGDYWQNVNDVCVGEYWTNLPNHSDEFSEESNLISGCPNVIGNQNEEFELYIDDPTALEAGEVYYITTKFHLHSGYQNSNYQFYISKVEYCVLYTQWDWAYLCNVTGGKHTANLIEGYLQPAP